MGGLLGAPHIETAQTGTPVTGSSLESRDASLESLAGLSRSGRISMVVTRHVFTMWTFAAIILFTAFWVLWQVSPWTLHFDPFPGLVVYLLISNFVQLLLMPLVGAGQTAEAQFDAIKAHIDHENG